MSEREEEKFVRELFVARFQADLRKIPKGPTKTPDFNLLADAQAVAVLEVKRIERTSRTPENGWTVDEGGFSTAVDNAPKRIATLIHVAWKQLSTSALPKVLVFVNDDLLVNVDDLQEAFDGFMFYGDEKFGYYNTASAKVAAGRVNDEKRKIDLYVWVDRTERGPCTPRFRFVTEAGHQLAVRHFAAPP